MVNENKKRIKSFLETLKDYEVHGGEVSNYKETLVNLRESIKKSLFSEKNSKVLEILFDALIEINKNIDYIDILRTGDKDADKFIQERKLIQLLASMLVKKAEILLLEYTINEK